MRISPCHHLLKILQAATTHPISAKRIQIQHKCGCLARVDVSACYRTLQSNHSGNNDDMITIRYIYILQIYKLLQAALVAIACAKPLNG